MRDESESIDFAGKAGFIWWVGVIEDRKDPIKLGRCRVRCASWHSDNKMQLPTEKLPWATPINPSNNTSTYPPKEGDMVFGFFADGENAQEPIILGTFPGIALKEANRQNSFNDPRTDSELQSAPRTPKNKTYNTNGSGITIEEKTQAESYPRILDEPSTSRIARNDSESISKTFINERKTNRVSSVPTATSSWSEPETKYDTKYPYNNVMETESGHLLEFDDTYNKERIHIAHRNGSFIEWFPDGTRVEKITKDNYSIVMKDDNVYIMGKCNITVQGNAEVYVKENAYVKVDKNVEMTVGGDVTASVGGDVTATASSFILNGPTTINGTLHVTGGISGDSGSSITGSISATGDITGGSISLQNHTHTDTAGLGAGTTSPPN
jgi:hypothetical protein